MIWKDVEEQYGMDMANRMKNSKMLTGITVTIQDDGEFDIPERDIELAYRDVTGGYIHPFEWD